MWDINKVITQGNKKDMINELFNEAYVVKQEALRDNEAQLRQAKKSLKKQGFDDDYIDRYVLGVSREKITGFYIHLAKNVPDQKMKSISPLFRMFYTCEGDSKKIMLGDTNALDLENTLQDARLHIVECLNKLIDGEFNHKLDKDLKINNLNDFRVILFDDALSQKLANFIITYNKFKMVNLARRGSNPDFECIWDKHLKKWVFNKIEKVYLDKPDADNSGRDNYARVKDKNKNIVELIDEEYKEDNSTTFIQYVLNNYVKKGALTAKQYEFWNDALKLGIGSKELLEVYSKQQIYQFKKQILKRLESKLAADTNVKFIEGTTTYRWVKTALLKENGENIFRRIEINNEGRYILLENYPTLNKNGAEDIKNGKIA